MSLAKGTKGTKVRAEVFPSLPSIPSRDNWVGQSKMNLEDQCQVRLAVSGSPTTTQTVPLSLNGADTRKPMKILPLFLAVIVFATNGFARSWPEWLPTHVSEIRFRDGVPGGQIRTTTDRNEIEAILQAFRRAQKVRTKESSVRWQQVCFDMIGERPEQGRWLLNLDNGYCALLDPFNQPVYQLTEADRQMLRKYFPKGEKDSGKQE